MFNHIIIGGTFDRLHIGHKKIIDTAFKNGKLVTIGLAERFLFKSKILAGTIEDYQTRKKNILEYLKKNNWQKKAKFIPIVNFYGTTLTDRSIEAIVVSRATKNNAEIINKKREMIGFPKLEIIVVSDVLADDGKLITSEKIRLGQINEEGKIYNLRFKKTLILPKNLREELRKPLGEIAHLFQCFKTLEYPMIISVGDIVSIKLIEAGIIPDIKIIDFKTRREPITDKKLLVKNGFKVTIKNDRGTISVESFQAIKKAINNHFKGVKTQTIVVSGEEDLLVLPAVLFAPLGSVIFYGQWDRGAILVKTDKKVKTRVIKLLSLFK